jgi:hypothetical protein
MKNKIADAGYGAHKLIESLGKSGNDNALEELHAIASNALETLQKLSIEGNEIAANLLIKSLQEAINQLYEAQPKKRDTFIKLARNLQCWPGFITVEKDWEKHNKKVSENLQLGADVPLNYKGKQWSREQNPEVEAALILVNRLIHRNRAVKPSKKLPPFSRETVKEWWKAGREIFELNFGNDFENHPLFAKRYTEKNSGQSDSLKFKTWKRKIILSKMEQAFRSISKKT